MGTTASRHADALRVLLVDDHPRFRAGIRGRLVRAGVEVVGEAGDGGEAVREVERRRPDVVLMDLHMPEMSGSAATAEITRRVPETRVVMLSIASAEASVAEAMLAGACGYVLKSAAVRDVLEAIAAAKAGDTFLSPEVASTLLERWRTLERSARAGAGNANLSPRELDVLRLIAAGEENAEIAERLSISPHTVKRHVAAILTKLRAANRTEAAVQAVRERII